MVQELKSYRSRQEKLVRLVRGCRPARSSQLEPVLYTETCHVARTLVKILPFRGAIAKVRPPQKIRRWRILEELLAEKEAIWQDLPLLQAAAVRRGSRPPHAGAPRLARVQPRAVRDPLDAQKVGPAGSAATSSPSRSVRSSSGREKRCQSEGLESQNHGYLNLEKIMSQEYGPTFPD